MRVVIQRVTSASVTVDGTVIGSNGHGLMMLVGVHVNDTDSLVDRMVAKCTNVRIFGDENGKMNLSLKEIGGSVLCVASLFLNVMQWRAATSKFLNEIDQINHGDARATADVIDTARCHRVGRGGEIGLDDIGNKGEIASL